MHETDRHRLHALCAQALSRTADRAFIEREQHAPSAVQALAYGKPQRTRHERRRAFHVDVVLLEALLVPHLENVPHALGGHECGARALALDQRVRRQRRAVDEDRHVRGCALRVGEHAPDAFHDPSFRSRCSQDFTRVTALRRLEHDVGERSADIRGELR
jgi:hypothetical protein